MHIERRYFSRYTEREEQLNSISHGIGICIGIIAGVFLLRKAWIGGDPWAIASVSIYIFGMLSCYISSTLYHASRSENKELLRKFDHAAIYVHIAATYTPFALVVLRNAGYWGWGIFIFVWLFAVIGIIMSFRRLKEHSNLETISFIGMGCVILVAIKPLIDQLSATGSMASFWWLLGGGVSYIIGALFYSRPRVKYMHCVFHFFCLGGSIGHIIAIWLIL